MKVRTVAIIGAGAAGRWLAGLSAAAGFHTVLEDILPSNLRKAEEQVRGPLAGGLRFASSVEEAVRDADLVLDSVPDELESKLEIFSLLDRMAPPRSIFLTPTRTLSIADLASCTYRPDRCIAFQVEPASTSSGPVRLISTSITSPEAVDAVEAFWKQCGFSIDRQTDSAEASVAAGTLF